MEIVQTSIKLPEPQWAALKVLAQRNRCTIGDVVSLALSALAPNLDDPPAGLSAEVSWRGMEVGTEGVPTGSLR